MISRTIYKEILKAISEKPIVFITGARQVGKTTICTDRLTKEMGYSYVSLEDPLVRQDALADPSAFLSLHPSPLIIDEIQKAPILFDYLEGRVDEGKKLGKPVHYILTGSEAYKLSAGVTESMRGRVAYIHMSPLSMSEIQGKEEIPFEVNPERVAKRCEGYQIDTLDLYRYIVRGFYPELYENRNLSPSSFYADYVESYLTKDVSEIIDIKDKSKFLNLMTLLASLTGEELNCSSLSNAIGIDQKTVEKWLSALEAGDIIHLLQPYHETSIKKQIVKRPKVYFSDTGLACYLARVNSPETLIASYLRGHMVETYIINEIIKSYKNSREERQTGFYYYRDSLQNEVDLVLLRDGRLTLIEAKAGESYNLTGVKGFKALANTHYKMKENAIICTTSKPYPIGNNVFVLPVASI